MEANEIAKLFEAYMKVCRGHEEGMDEHAQKEFKRVILETLTNNTLKTHTPIQKSTMISIPEVASDMNCLLNTVELHAIERRTRSAWHIKNGFGGTSYLYEERERPFIQGVIQKFLDETK